MKVTRAIVNAIRGQNPPGRFLSFNSQSGTWYDVGDKKAIEKTSQALREGLTKIREKVLCNERLAASLAAHSPLKKLSLAACMVETSSDISGIDDNQGRKVSQQISQTLNDTSVAKKNQIIDSNHKLSSQEIKDDRNYLEDSNQNGLEIIDTSSVVDREDRSICLNFKLKRKLYHQNNDMLCASNVSKKSKKRLNFYQNQAA